jgi:uncharacterized protein YlbG (UPF0298 family)
VKNLFKEIFGKLFYSDQKQTQSVVRYVNHDEVEALVDSKFKEHASALQNTSNNQNQSNEQEDISLTAKQVEFAVSLIEKVNNEFELAINPAKLTIKDLNKLIAFNRFKNKGILINLVKKGVLRKK